VVPETAGALLAFLGLVAPGVLYELLRERRQAALNDSSFREASLVALLSLAFTLVSLGILALVRSIVPGWMPDPGAWLRHGSRYADRHYRLVVRTLAIEVGLACLAALAAYQLVARFGGPAGKMHRRSVWFQVLRAARPKDMVPWVHVHLSDKTDIWGYVAYYSPEESLADREIALQGPGLAVQRLGEPAPVVMNNWASLTVAHRDILYIKVLYKDEARPPAPVAGPRWWRRGPG